MNCKPPVVAKLHDYAHRRDFDRTPEPPPRAAKQTEGPRRFVVQAHAARTMHYDFRLQVGDVLVSWAVPKGPSLNPKDRRLALRTEDHPLEYASFEGVIPKGQYGGGSVIVWDEGTWEVDGDAREGLKQGKLRFTLHGRKLAGRFHLTRTRGRASERNKSAEDGSAWLLIKGRDAEARDDEESIVQKAPESVLSGRTVEEVAPSHLSVPRAKQAQKEIPKPGPGPRPSDLPEARKAPFLAQRRPELATLTNEPPPGDTFLHEAKLDGYRLLAEVRSGEVKLWTRGHKDWSGRFPFLVRYLSEVRLGDVLLDGEIVALDERGLSNFQLLQNVIGSPQQGRLLYIVFDLLHQDGYDLAKVPLIHRKAALSRLLTRAGADPLAVRFSEHVIGNGPAFFAQACELGMEGVVSKRMDAPYRGERSQAWFKCKCLKRQEVVIGGFTDPSGSRSGLGALLVGLHDETGRLRYAGKVGTGFTEKSLKALHARLLILTQETSPFENPPRGAEARGVHWVKPELLAEVAFSEVTTGGKLRHPSFQGLREDKSPAHVPLERPLDPPLPQAERSRERPKLPLALTHPTRVLYPEQGVTKQELAEYYVRVAERMLPYVADRLLTLVRCPSGEGNPCFYQKHAKAGLPDSIHGHAVPGDADQYVYVSDAAGLVGLVQVGVLEIHTWGSKVDRLDYPDQLVFDLDPDPELNWVRIVEGALDVRDELEEDGLRSFIKTTGGKGLHVVVPLSPQAAWPEVKAFCKALAERMARKQPSRYVATMTKKKRAGKIFVDYLRNAREATAIAPYATRARPGAPVATPLAWEELARDVRNELSLRTVLERLSSQEMDPWQEFFDVKQTLPERDD